MIEQTQNVDAKHRPPPSTNSLQARRFDHAGPAIFEHPGQRVSATRAPTTNLFIPTKDIVYAEPEELPFVIDLQKKFSNALGFLPHEALQWYVENKRILLARENGEPAGYALGRELLRWNPAIRPITQAAIAFDAQRRHIGLAIVSRIEDAAREAGQVALQACCRQGLDANAFWKEAGFEKICQLTPNTARGRQMNVWRKLIWIHRPTWFDAPPPVAGWKAKKARL